jgi:lysophospholipase L1-like esterase
MYLSFFLFISLVVVGWLMYNLFRVQKLIQVSVGIQTVDPYEQIPDMSSKKILVVGDSTAVGTGSLDPTKSVAGRLGAEYPYATIVNHSKNGRKTGEMIAVVKEEEGKRFDLVLLQTGGNDIIRFVPLEKVASDVDTLLTESKKLSDRVVLVTSGDVGAAPFFPRPINIFWSRRTSAVRVLFMDAAKKHDVVYVDLLGYGVDGIFNTDIKKYYSPDLLHPSEDGYGVWYDYIGPAITQSLAQ